MIPIPLSVFDMPTLAHVEKALRQAHASLRSVGALTKGGWADVRLQVYEDGQWALRTGLSDYDQDHRGFIAAGAMPFAKSGVDFKGMARALVADCAEQAAELESIRDRVAAAKSVTHGP